jgi:hypothetical protein
VEIKPAERQSKWRRFKCKVSENLQGKDVKAASETNVFIGLAFCFCGFPSLQTSADGPLHGFQEEGFLRSTYPCGPKSGSQTTSEINVEITLA